MEKMRNKIDVNNVNVQENLITVVELDYCQYMLFETIKGLNLTQPKAMRPPIDKLIDEATGFGIVEWRMVAIALYWCSEVIDRKKKLDYPYEETEFLRKGLEEFMINCGKEDFYKKILAEIENESFK